MSCGCCSYCDHVGCRSEAPAPHGLALAHQLQPLGHLVPTVGPRRLSLLHSPPCPGLGPKGACLGGSFLVSLSIHQPIPSCSVLIISIATGIVRYRNHLPGGAEARPRGPRICGLLWGVCRLHLCCFLPSCWCGGHSHLPHSLERRL